MIVTTWQFQDRGDRWQILHLQNPLMWEMEHPCSARAQLNFQGLFSEYHRVTPVPIVQEVDKWLGCESSSDHIRPGSRGQYSAPADTQVSPRPPRWAPLVREILGALPNPSKPPHPHPCLSGANSWAWLTGIPSIKLGQEEEGGTNQKMRLFQGIDSDNKCAEWLGPEQEGGA